MSVRKELGIRLKALREARKFKQRDLAEKLGCQQAYISELETGRTPIPLETLLKIVNFLEADLNYFDLRKTPALPEEKKPILERAFFDRESLIFIANVAKKIAMRIYQQTQDNSGIATNEIIDSIAIREVMDALHRR